jgi:hypothetical protein
MRRTKANTRTTDSYPSARAGRAQRRSTAGPDTHGARIFRIAKGKLQVCSLVDQKRVRPPGTEEFATERQLERLTASWPVSRLVEMWNCLPGLKRVRKFTDRKTAVRRIWHAIQRLEVGSDGKGAIGSGLHHSSASRVPHKPVARGTGTPATKADQIIALLKRPSGATLKSIMAVTGWQAHSVRGFISGQLRKRMCLDVRSFERNGERVYSMRGGS